MQPAAYHCIISAPAAGDPVPVVIDLPDADPGNCQSGMAGLGAPGATYIQAVPDTTPVCDLTITGVHIIVYGDAAVGYVCQRLAAEQ